MKVSACTVLMFAAVSLTAQSMRTAYTPTSHASQSVEDLRDLANRANKAGDLPSAANFFCQAAMQDNRYTKHCDKAKMDLEKTLLQYQADLNMGRTEIAHKDFGGAIRDLSRITFGPNKEEALELLQQARVGSGQISPEAASQATLGAARAAYESGNFDRAEALLKSVQAPGSRYAANQMLTNIAVYRDTMNHAQSLTHSRDKNGAAPKKGFAAAIQPRGPGQPQQHLRDAQDAEAKADAANAQQVANQRLQEQQAAAAEAKATPQLPTQMNTAAKIKASLAAAQRLETEGHPRAALESYETVLKMDSHQKDALAGKQRVMAAQHADPEATEQSLMQGVTDFYASRFPQANDNIRSYLQGGGKQHSGAAHFFLGASVLSQALLADPGDPKKVEDLRMQAHQEFILAKQMHYVAPSEAISPKLLAQWSQAGAQP